MQTPLRNPPAHYESLAVESVGLADLRKASPDFEATPVPETARVGGGLLEPSESLLGTPITEVWLLGNAPLRLWTTVSQPGSVQLGVAERLPNMTSDDLARQNAARIQLLARRFVGGDDTSNELTARLAILTERVRLLSQRVTPDGIRDLETMIEDAERDKEETARLMKSLDIRNGR